MLLKVVQCQSNLPEDMNGETLIIVGQALIISLGKPPTTTTSRALSDIALPAAEKPEVTYII